MSLTPRLTMIGMYKYDPDLFHLLSLPDGMDKDLFVNSLLMRYGENPVVFPSVPFFKSAVGVWSAKWYDSLERMLEAITEEYNPLHNYDRHETYTDTEAKESAGSDRVTRSDTETATRTATTTGSDTKNGTVTDSGSESSEYVTDTTTTSSEEKKISAENESTYQPDNSTEDTGTLDSTVTGEVTKGNTRTNTETGSNTENITENNNKTGSGTDTRTTSGTDDRTLQHNAHLYGNIGVTTSQQMLMEEINLRKDLSIYDVAAELFYREFCLYVY